MKKYLLVLLGIFPVLIASQGCNKQLFDFKLKFKTAIVKWPDGTTREIQIRKWNDYEHSDQIQVIGTDGNVYLFHSNNVVLIGDD